MADFVDSTVKDIDKRLSELKVEVSKLEAARAALVGGRRGPGRPASANGAAASTPTRRRTTRRAGRPRGRRGGNTRANQALALVQERPGITIPEIAEALKIEPNYLYRVMPKLVEDGQVSREGQGWHPAAAKS
ncbi:MAG TPA: winged helix-turn-helix transcriptional regulator [Solirubrobacteraceae bacterium]|nr:winged helix-turn-helix transcriptional regulator [Solirubrobacteraceae bacterium]